MKRIVTLLLVLAPSLCIAQFKDGGYSDLYDSDVVSSMKEHVSFLSSASLEGRGAGTDGELEAARYLTSIFEQYGLDVLSGSDGDLFGLRQENGDTLRSRNVIAHVAGYDRELKEHFIIIGARMDNLGVQTINVNGVDSERVFYGANGNGSGLAMLLELAGKLNTNSVLLKRSVLLVAFGSSLKDNAGSWYFLNRSFPAVDKIDAMINLDMLGTGSAGFYAYTGSNEDMNKIVSNLSTTLQPIQPRIVSLEPVKSDHRMFYDKEIPSIMFTTGMYREYNSTSDTADILEYDTMERELEYIYNYTLSLVNGNAPEFSPSHNTRKVYTTKDGIVPYSECDFKPTFLGSSDPVVFLQKWVYVYLKYPKEAVREGIQGRVLVDFVINEKGKVTDVKVVKGVHSLLDDEAVRVISASPDWKPGRVRGEKVRTELSLNVEFRLQKKK